jgi:predicted phosphodiesterase
MRIALISDIHANLPALEAVLTGIDGDSSIDAAYHLGDLVGYAPWPNEVVDLLRSRGITGVAGNYDSTTAMHYKHCVSPQLCVDTGAYFARIETLARGAAVPARYSAIGRAHLRTPLDPRAW